MQSPWDDTQFLSAVERWHRIRQSIRVPHNPLPPSHADHVYCAYMYLCFDGQIDPLCEYMAGDYHTRRLTALFSHAREKYYQYGIDDR